MASFWFLTLLFKCIDFLLWPVLALGHPLCASIEAIENDSHTDIWNLISYWILLSLIYLFEYAFLKLLQWFQYWHYMKLMIVAFLVTPDFGRSAYVYNHFIQSCIHMNPEAVISRLRSWKSIFVRKEDFVMQVEKYITQNGTEALEKLISSKNTEKSLHAETGKSVPTTAKNEIPKNQANEPFLLLKNTAENLVTETTRTVPTIRKNEAQETNRGSLLMEQKDIKDLEMIEKEQVPEGKQAITVLERPKSNESTSSTMVKTEKMATDTECGTYPQISASENVQKEWTCAICQLTMPSEANLNSHLQGRKHKAACEALNTKTKAMPMKDTGGSRASPQVSASKNVQESWTSDICHLTMLSEANLKSHLQELKHTACDAINISQQNKNKYVDANTKVQGLQKNVGTSIGMNSSRFRCDICNVNCTSVGDLASHLRGRKHLAQSQLLGGTGWD